MSAKEVWEEAKSAVGRLREATERAMGSYYYHIWTSNPRFYSLLPYMDV